MRFTISTKGHSDIIDITDTVRKFVLEQKVKSGILLVSVKGSTAAVTTMEYEEGVIHDLKAVLEKLAPEDAEYEHHKRWGDRNGAAHIKSALIGTSLVLPIENGSIGLGTWQQIVLIDFDMRPREREISLILMTS